MDKLSVIIPFRNEKEEVAYTLDSILSHSNNNVDIILINDNSDDNFEYDELVKQYDITYLKNEECLGPARCRDIGVRASINEYFILLDAHMRFFQTGWVELIIKTLRENPKLLICCQTTGFKIIDGKYISRPLEPTPYGAFLNFECENGVFNLEFLHRKHDDSIIPCVIGATYACSKSYWHSIKGLEGLVAYGSEEPYISMKVWLSGGECRLLDEITVGHLYREDFPYFQQSLYALYNKLFITELFLPFEHKRRIRTNIRRKLSVGNYSAIVNMLYDNHTTTCELKEYYNGIFTKSFKYFEQINNSQTTSKDRRDEEKQLTRLAQHFIDSFEKVNHPGLYEGKMGISIFMAHFSRYNTDPTYDNFFKKCLRSVWLDSIHISSWSLCDGLTGIGWGIEYLKRNRFIEEDANEILSYFDDYLLRLDPFSFKDFSIARGLAGLLHYLKARILSNDYNLDFLKNNYAFIVSLRKLLGNDFLSKELKSDGMDIYRDFHHFLKYGSFWESGISFHDICDSTVIPVDFDKIGPDRNNSDISSYVNTSLKYFI